MTHSPASAFLRLSAVVARTGLGRSSIYIRVKAGTFPPPVKIGVKAIAWLESDVEAWIAATVKAARTVRRNASKPVAQG